jgi:hypothetical protein
MQNTEIKIINANLAYGIRQYKNAKKKLLNFSIFVCTHTWWWLLAETCSGTVNTQ